MDALKLTEHIGKQGLLSTSNSPLKVLVNITNARERWGQIDFLVTPVSGSGEQWVSSARVTVAELRQIEAEAQHE